MKLSRIDRILERDLVKKYPDVRIHNRPNSYSVELPDHHITVCDTGIRNTLKKVNRILKKYENKKEE